MAPSSVWFTKQLPINKWIELCNSIPKEVTIYLLGGAGDKVLCEEILNKTTHSTVRILAGELSLLESCELMKHAKMNYVNDSGPLHLASSVNAPTTAFFCSTVPSYGFFPLSYNSTIIEVSDLGSDFDRQINEKIISSGFTHVRDSHHHRSSVTKQMFCDKLYVRN
jgi:heptosyltransferase-2